MALAYARGKDLLFFLAEAPGMIASWTLMVLVFLPLLICR